MTLDGTFNSVFQTSSMPTLHIGIDMHGTLITDNGERIPPNLVGPLAKALRKVRESGKARVYLCTGNDLGFVKRKIEPEVLEQFDGHILEMGCVFSDGTSERLMLPSGLAAQMKELEEKLKGINFPEAYKFARRLAIISIFTKHGKRPEEILPKVQKSMEKFGYSKIARPVCSSVAVDIVPFGYSKLTGMRHIAAGGTVMGIADSMNDIELIMGADRAVIPSNSKSELLEEVKKAGNSNIRISGKTLTEVVIEALDTVVRE